jgi:osmotically inducible protein OsmC
MEVRTAETQWLGDSKNGRGRVKFGSDELEKSYSVESRFENMPGTNPEELLGATQAACFNIELAGLLEQEGYAVQAIHTIASMSIDNIGQKNKITSMEIDTEAKVLPHIDTVILREQAELAKNHCPAPFALSGVDVKLSARRMLMAA